jgi:hypothetical protein
MGVTAAVVATTIVATSEARKREKRVERRQKEAQAVERAERASQATRARRQAVREARIRRAEVEQQAATGGQTGSSAAVAASDSLTAQLGSNIGTIGTSLATGEAKSIAEQNIFDANRKSNLEVIAGVGTQIGSRFIGGS